MGLSKNDLNITSLNDAEIFDVQKSALLLDTSGNPVFVPPVTAKGEEYSSGTRGDSIANAVAPVGLNNDHASLGPVISDDTKTQEIITILQSDTVSYFVTPGDFPDADSVTRLFLGTPPRNDLLPNTNVCVLNNAVLGKAVKDVQACLDNIDPSLSKKAKKKATRACKQATPWSCASGTYHATFDVNEFYYSLPYRLDEYITVTGYSYVDDNGGTGTIIDDVDPFANTDYIHIEFPYTAGDACYTTLDSKLTAAGKAAIAGKSFNLSIRFLMLGSMGGGIQPLCTDSKSVVGAVCELYDDANRAAVDAANVEKSVWVGGVGDWRNSQIPLIDDPLSLDPSDMVANPNFDTVSYNALLSKNADWDTMIALRKLNLIPVLLKDKVLSAVEYLDEGDPDDPDDDELKTRLELVADSQVNLLESTFTLWRHISAMSTAAWGISALTDLDIYDDKHEYIEPLKLNSFIQNFNLLYTTIDAVSGDVDLLQHALSGSDPGDSLIEPLSGYSVYMNLNNLYTELSGLSGDVFKNTTNIDVLSAAIDACCAAGDDGEGVNLPCDDICKTLDSIEGPAIDCKYPGGFTVDWPVDDSHYKPYKREDGDYPEVKDTSIIYEHTPLATASVATVRYLWQANDDTWHIGDAPGETVDTAPNTPLILEGTPIDPVYPDGLLIPGGMGAPLSGAPDPLPPFSEKLCAITECCDLIKNYISTTGGDTTIISLSSLVTKNIIDITSLSGCCDTCSPTLSYNVLIPNHPDPSLANGTWSRSFEYVVNQTETFTESFMYSTASVAGFAPHSTWQINNATLTYYDGTIQPVTLRDRTAIPTTTNDENGNLGHNLHFTFDVPCTTTNNSKLLALSAAIYGPTYGDQWDIYFTNPDTGIPGSIITNINKLRYDITQIDIGSPNNQININKTNITTLSGNVDALSACCDLNRTDINILSADILALETHEHDGGVPADHGHPGLSALSAAVYGDSYTDVYYNENNPDYSVVQHINHLYEAGDTEHAHTAIDINTTNITTNTTNINSISGDIDALSGCCEANRTDISLLSGDVSGNTYNISNIDTDITNINTDITTISGDVITIGGDYVNRTTNQSVSGEKVFKDVLTVSTSANIADTVTIGGGDTVFNVCAEENGITTMVINNLQTDPAQVPTNGVYIADINGTKILAIKV